MRLMCCDDNVTFLNELERYIKLHFEGENFESIKFLSSGRELIDLIEEITPDIVILDIEMPEYDGFQVARVLNETLKDVEIIFLTSRNELVYSSFSYKPFNFVRKEHYLLELRESLFKCIESVRMKKTTFSINTKEGQVVVRFDEIMYVNVQNSKVTFNTSIGTIESIGLFKDVVPPFLDRGFCYAYRGCIVNLDFVRGLCDKGVMLKNSTRLDVSRRRAREFKKKLNEHIIRRRLT